MYGKLAPIFKIFVCTVLMQYQVCWSSELSNIDVTTMQPTALNRPSWFFATIDEALHFDPWRNKREIKSWTISERTIIERKMKHIQNKYRRLLTRAGTLALVRTKGTKYCPLASAFAGVIFIPDKYFNEQHDDEILTTLLHEITHSADWGNLISDSGEWVEFCKTVKAGNPPQYPMNRSELLAWYMEFSEIKNRLYDSTEFKRRFLPKLNGGPQEYDTFNQLMMKSSLAHKQRKFVLAFKLADEAERLFPNTAKPHLIKAICLGKIGKSERGLDECLLAISCYDKAKVPDYSSDYLQALCTKASLLIALGQYREANQVIAKVTSSPNKIAIPETKRLRKQIVEKTQKKSQ